MRFILNNNEVSTDLPAGMLVLDYVRYSRHLTGTKIGCREGDCGACTVLVGELKGDEVVYQSFTSCLTPLGNVQGKHVVTIEGINAEGLNVVQQAMADNSATQCGFCTPGFVVSLAGFCLSGKEPSNENAIASIDGNICRCTGYKSIEKAAAQVAQALQNRSGESLLQFLSAKQFLPEYFAGIKERLRSLAAQSNGPANGKPASFVGGGTDLYVQKHEEMKYADIQFLFGNSDLRGIRVDSNTCTIGAATTVTELQHSQVFREHFPNFAKHVKLVSSTPIRNMATVAGNFVNASPIGDFTIFFLALNAKLFLSDGANERQFPLREFYKGYKQLNKTTDEFISKISFDLPAPGSLFNFEKVSKRTHLDIASVNTAILLETNSGLISKAAISAGGVGPTPLFLAKTSELLKGKELSEEIITKAIAMAQTEISPISDARGTEEYKRLLLCQLIRAHFIVLFPEADLPELLHR